MGTAISKVSGIQLPGQSGKTRKMEEKLSEYMSHTRNEGCEDDLNIMFTSNSRLLVDQTAKRFDYDLGPQDYEEESIDSYNTNDSSDLDEETLAVLKNGCMTWTSSENLSARELAFKIIENELDMIVCCSHPKRWKKIGGRNINHEGLILLLEKSRHFKKNINIWIDEAHKSIKLWKQYIHILDYQKVKKVTLVSASWDPIDKEYTIPRVPYEITHPEVYRSLHECKWIIVEHTLKNADDMNDQNSTAPSYITQVMSMPEIRSLMTPGSMWLTPGNTKTITHDAIQEDLTNAGLNGLKLNGLDKSFAFFIQNRTIDYNSYNKEKLEPKDVLVKAFQEYKCLQEAPFFITGLNCIKEGITFQSDSLHFRGGILPPISDPSDAYQLACRLAGNIKGHNAYNPNEPCVIITTSKMEKKIKRQENIAIFLPRILYEEGRTIPTEFDKRRAARGKCLHDPKGLGYRIFRSYEKFTKFLDLIGKNSGFKNEPNGVDKWTGWFVCSVQSSRGATQKPRYVTEVIDKIDLAYGGKGTRSGFPAYTDLHEEKINNNNLVWIAVVSDSLKKKNIEEADTKYPDESDEVLKISKHYTEV